MEVEEIQSEINRLCSIALERKDAAEPEGMNPCFMNPLLSYLTTEEKQELHDLKLALPSFGQERLEAIERNKQRIKQRNERNAKRRAASN